METQIAHVTIDIPFDQEAETQNEAQAGFCEGLQAKVITGVGEIFKSLSAVVNNAHLFGSVLQSIKHASVAARYAKIELIDSDSNKLDKAIGIISITRIFSDICYLCTGEFNLDLLRGRISLALGQLSLAISNAITTIITVIKIVENGVFGKLDFKEGGTRILSFVSDGFAIAGFVGHIGDSIQRLVQSQGLNLQAWSELAASGFGLCLPIAAIAGVTSPPVLITFGVLSCLCGAAAGIIAEYCGPLEEKVAEDFAECSKDLAKVMGAFSSFMSISTSFFEDEKFSPVHEFASAAKTFCSIRKGVQLVNCGREWFSVNSNGAYIWEEGSVWRLGNKALSTGKTLMNFYSFLDSMSLIKNETLLNKCIWNIPIFKTVKNVFGLGAHILKFIDNAIKWSKVSPRHQRLAEKFNLWNAAEGFLQDELSMDHVYAWRDVQQTTVLRYTLKMQNELARGVVHDRNRVALWLRHISHLSNGNLNIYLEDKRQSYLSKLAICLSNCHSREWQEAFQAEINTIELFSPQDFLLYRQSIAKNRFSHSSAEKAKIEWALASGVIKTLLAILNLVSECIGSASSSILASITKYGSIAHKVASYSAGVFISIRYSAGEENLILTSLPKPSVYARIYRRKLRYLPAA